MSNKKKTPTKNIPQQNTRSKRLYLLVLSIIGAAIASFVSQRAQTDFGLMSADILQGVFLMSIIIILGKMTSAKMKQKKVQG
jgi:hypothetical protein